MSVTTIRAAQNSHDFTLNGGTRDPQFVLRDVVPFMDAIEDQRTLTLDSLKKGSALTTVRPEWGEHGITPRGSKLAVAALVGDTALTFATGHTARFQQMHMLRITRASDGLYEHVWVNDDPALTTISVKRAQGGTTALAFAIGDDVKIVGIAMPQLADFPLAMVSRGMKYYNRWQTFAKHLVHSDEADQIPSVDNPNGSLITRDKMQIAKDLKMDLDQALLLGRRQSENPDHADPTPETMGGILHMAELSGNAYNVGGAAVKLSAESIEYVQGELDRLYGQNAPTKYIMSLRTKRIFNRLMAPAKYENGTAGTSFDLRWNTVTTDVGTIDFSFHQDFPDGMILAYSPKNIEYNPFAGHDWKEKEFPTKGFYSWNGIGGKYTMTAKRVSGMAIINGFNQTLSAYPSHNTPPV